MNNNSRLASINDHIDNAGRHNTAYRCKSAECWSYVLAFGANTDGKFGSPEETLSIVQRKLGEENVKILATCPPILTRPVGGMTRLPYLNTVLVVKAAYAPADMLRRLKRLERAAGRMVKARNSARPLDLDILLWRGGRVGWLAKGRSAGILQIPHPELHRRAFMMVPLTGVLPGWWHPGLRLPGRRLVKAIRITPADLGIAVQHLP